MEYLLQQLLIFRSNLVHFSDRYIISVCYWWIATLKLGSLCVPHGTISHSGNVIML